MRMESGGEIGLFIPLLCLRAARCLALGHPHPGKAPSQGHALGPALRNEREQVSSGPRTLKWEDSNELSGFAKAASGMRILPFLEGGGRGRGGRQAWRDWDQVRRG